ncbi:MAG TPA: hypothetical protein ENH82_11755 [bacterium]|nr:hypothetical protein [bacterium]
MYNLVKSSRRLAMEIKGKSRHDAEDHLIQYGYPVAGASAVIAMHTGKDGRVIGNLTEIAKSIEANTLTPIPCP